MTDKPTTPPAGEPTVMSTRQRAEACIDEIIETIDDLYSSAEAETAHQENIAAIESALDAHTATLRADFERRMGMSQHALGAALKARDEAQSKLAEARGTIKGCRAALYLTPHATDVDVVMSALCEVQDATRLHDEKMAYFQRATAAEAKLAATEAQLAEAHGYGSRLFKSLAPQCEPLDTAVGVFTQLDNWSVGIQRCVKAAEARVARCHRLLRDVDFGRNDKLSFRLWDEIRNELTAPPVVPE